MAEIDKALPNTETVVKVPAEEELVEEFRKLLQWYGDVVDYQVGADRVSNESENMRKVRKGIEKILEANYDVILNGKRMFLDTNNVPKELSVTFTLRTPPNTDRLEYVKQLQDELLKVNKSTKEVINK